MTPARAVLLAAVSLVAPLAVPAAQEAVSVTPAFASHLIAPGEQAEDVITLASRTSAVLEVTVALADFDADEHDGVVELPSGTSTSSLAPFFRIAPLAARVAPGATASFRYRAAPPRDFVHLRAMVFFLCRPGSAAGEPGATVVVPRIGVPVYVESARARPAHLDASGLAVERAGDRLRLRLVLTNDGERLVRPTGSVLVRPGVGRGDVLRFNRESHPVLPGHRVLWEEDLGPAPADATEVVLRLSTSAGGERSFAVRLPSLRPES